MRVTCHYHRDALESGVITQEVGDYRFTLHRGRIHVQDSLGLSYVMQQITTHSFTSTGSVNCSVHIRQRVEDYMLEIEFNAPPYHNSLVEGVRYYLQDLTQDELNQLTAPTKKSNRSVLLLIH